MIPPELEAKILRLYHAEKWRIGTIATQVGVHHSTVRRVLAQAQIPAGHQTLRPSIAEPYLAFLVATLKKYPKLRASRLYEMVRQRGYPGGPDHFRSIVARYRPRPHAEAYLRLRTLPAEQGRGRSSCASTSTPRWPTSCAVTWRPSRSWEVFPEPSCTTI
jgi:transposase